MMGEAYQALNEQTAVDYARRLEGVFPEGAVLENREIGDGNLNLVFHIVDPASGRSVIIKQALPYARVVGESWPLTLDRARIEGDALQLHNQWAPGLVPKVFASDKEQALTVMEDLSDHIILRKGMIGRTRYPRLAEDMAVFLARTLFFSSEYALTPAEKKARVRQFINPEMCDITEKLVFTDPYYDAETNSFNPLIREEVESIWKNEGLKREVAQLKESFMGRAQALLHGDLHTGSIMVTAESTKVIDPEFAFYGPMGFDVGALWANFFLSYVSQEGHPGDAEEIRSYREWIRETAEAMWTGFESRFRTLWQEHVTDPMWTAPGFLDDVMHQVLQDAAGFAGCKMMRRVIGLAPVADLESIEDAAERAKAEKLALEVGKALVLRRRNLHSAEDVLRLVCSIASKQEVQA
jgi:5-methylthioribose kinase